MCIYVCVYVSGGITLNKEVISKAIRSIYAKEGLDNRVCDLKKWKSSDLKTHCESCTLAFEDDNDSKMDSGNKDAEACIREQLKCHANICNLSWKGLKVHLAIIIVTHCYKLLHVNKAISLKIG